MLRDILHDEYFSGRQLIGVINWRHYYWFRIKNISDLHTKRLSSMNGGQ